jgi:hypothetical protein
MFDETLDFLNNMSMARIGFAMLISAGVIYGIIEIFKTPWGTWKKRKK